MCMFKSILKQDNRFDGYFTAVCTQIGSKWLVTGTMLAAGISNLALFEAEMSTDSFHVDGKIKTKRKPLAREEDCLIVKYHLWKPQHLFRSHQYHPTSDDDLLATNIHPTL
mmetsp:Transcript_45987/g.55767  ORF Transcript_45987/g.55767 Transcript_45987/m.55767 type:complete len:111 (+) Transcript_45987:576-908(+)